ncbi:hypothetical protein [Phenylobacterium sp.]|uniref:hypothetical protein n=1 Tax=Phenylobacterium sp. TaxID=1871053 RepID=UPI0025E0AE56|nr:hypothetical protein [Phenylobacterium sp.]
MRSAGFGMAAVGALAAGAARAQAPAYAAVPPDQRLTIFRVFGHASPVVQLVFALLLVSAVAALAVWAMSLRKVGTADARGLAQALGRLRILRSAATPLGLLAASYILFSGFLGISNIRPAPTITILAPGWAEAALAVMLGLLATTIAVVCERHLEGRIRRAAA